jgi:biopolymer transport protein ExbB
MQSMLSRLIASAALVSLVGLTVVPLATAQTPAPTPAPAAAPSPAPAAEAPKPAAPAAAKAAASSAAEENPFGFKAMVSHADFVTMTTLIIMIIMSLGSWYIIFTKLWEGRKVSNQAKEAEENFWSAGSVKSGTQNLAEDSPFRFIAEKGVEATQKHNGLLGQIELTDWITMGIQRAIDNISSRMSDGLAFLATVGSTAPFVGLFGTVWGIYNALVKIGISGSVWQLRFQRCWATTSSFARTRLRWIRFVRSALTFTPSCSLPPARRPKSWECRSAQPPKTTP